MISGRSNRFAHLRASEDQAKKVLKRLSETIPVSFGEFPLAVLKDEKTRILVHWVPTGKSGLLLISYPPSAQKLVEESTEGLLPAGQRLALSPNVSLFEEDHEN